LNVVSKDTVNEFVWGNVDLNSEHEPDHKQEKDATDEEHLQLAGLKRRKNSSAHWPTSFGLPAN